MFIPISYKIEVGNKTGSSIVEICPHCEEKVSLDEFLLHGELYWIIKTKQKAYECSSCKKNSIQSGICKKLVYFIIVLPFFVVCLGGVFAGVMGVKRLYEYGYDTTTLVLSILLLAVSGFLCYRLTKYCINLLMFKLVALSKDLSGNF